MGTHVVGVVLKHSYTDRRIAPNKLTADLGYLIRRHRQGQTRLILTSVQNGIAGDDGYRLIIVIPTGI